MKFLGLPHLSRQRAFTLIELLIVVVIIGILVALAAPSFLGQTDRAYDSQALQNLTNVYRSGKAAAWVDNAAYPALGTPGDTVSDDTLFGVLHSAEPQFIFATYVQRDDPNTIEVTTVNAQVVAYAAASKSGTIFCVEDIETQQTDSTGNTYAPGLYYSHGTGTSACGDPGANPPNSPPTSPITGTPPTGSAPNTPNNPSDPVGAPLPFPPYTAIFCGASPCLSGSTPGGSINQPDLVGLTQSFGSTSPIVVFDYSGNETESGYGSPTDYNEDPQFSPDKQHIAYLSYVGGYNGGYYAQLWVMNADGSGAQNLTPTLSSDSGALGNIQWVSSSRLCYENQPSTVNFMEPQIVCSDIDGSNLAQLTNFTDGTLYGFWVSPDGSKIAYNDYYNDSVYVMNTDGSGSPTKAFGEGESIGSVAWSSNSQELYVADYNSGGSGDGLWKVNADGTYPTQLSATQYYGVYPQPGGDKLLLGDANGGSVLANADGSNPVSVSGSGAPAGWRENGATAYAYDASNDGGVQSFAPDATSTSDHSFSTAPADGVSQYVEVSDVVPTSNTGATNTALTATSGGGTGGGTGGGGTGGGTGGGGPPTPCTGPTGPTELLKTGNIYNSTYFVANSDGSCVTKIATVSGNNSVVTDNIGDVWLSDPMGSGGIWRSTNGATPINYIQSPCPNEAGYGPYGVTQMAFTPDGTQGVWECEAGESGPSYIAYWNGTAVTDIYNDSYGYDVNAISFVISADGSRVAFVHSDRDASSGITYYYLAALSTSGAATQSYTPLGMVGQNAPFGTGPSVSTSIALTDSGTNIIFDAYEPFPNNDTLDLYKTPFGTENGVTELQGNVASTGPDGFVNIDNDHFLASSGCCDANGYDTMSVYNSDLSVASTPTLPATDPTTNQPYVLDGYSMTDNGGLPGGDDSVSLTGWPIINT